MENAAEQPNEPEGPQLTAGAGTVVEIWDNVLDKTKTILNEKLFDSIVKFLTTTGGYALMLTAAIGLINAFVCAIKFKSFTLFLSGFGWVVAVSILIYVAVKFSNAEEKLIKSSPTKMSTSALLECLALVSLVAGVLYLIFSIVMAIQVKAVSPLFSGIGAVIFCAGVAWITLNPRMANVDISPGAGAGEEAIGIVSFFVKGALKFVPIGYGAGVIYGAVLFIIAFIKLFGTDSPRIAISGATEAASVLATAALLPLFAYILFLFYYLAIDLINSILSLQKK